MARLYSISLIVFLFGFSSFFPIRVDGKEEKQKEVLNILKPFESTNTTIQEGELHPCTCGIFMDNQINKEGGQPTGNPILQHIYDEPFLPKNSLGAKFCVNKCVEIITKHLPNSQEILCTVIDKDIEREKAHLFVKNCEDKWLSSHLSSVQSYCCKNGIPYICPVLPIPILIKKLGR